MKGSWNMTRKDDLGTSSMIEKKILAFHQLPNILRQNHSIKQQDHSIMLVQRRKLSAELDKFKIEI